MNDPSNEDKPPPNQFQAIVEAAAVKNKLKLCAEDRRKLQQGVDLWPKHMKNAPRWDLHFTRLAEMERFLSGPRPADWAKRFEEMHDDFELDVRADMAAAYSESAERIVRFTDELAHRTEEKKFELPSETRDGLEEVLEPYKDKIRDEILDALPIETRRKIEEEKRRREEDDLTA